ncbi:BatA domain-containing protein [Pedobacter montanisoli]|uniref:BatA domain-containing protein n=1 Tax=Pedobacter montanisoli TaxID=2923277 RepID=A0ABS9ZZ95_9SPHI|nr:BatA domain-containing protein [Pedobacter montanisoli]MCJ0743640.1 BatA domain-containing protein [Pedobacter montanisoli]
MQFLYPIGLFALASLVIPLLIHLWQVKRGKTLKIGSISLLGESAASNSRSLRINDWLLFVLRCFLLILTVFLLAKPYLTAKPLSKQGGWILLQQQEFGSTYAAHQKTIDSLLGKGYQIRNFGYGFKELHLKDTANKFKDSVALSPVSLLKQVNHLLPNRYPVWLFTSKNKWPLDDELPVLHLQLHWKTVSLKDSLSHYYSEFLGRNYQATVVPYAIAYTQVNGQKPAALNVMIHPAESEDAKYVKAALAAIGDYTGQAIIFHSASQNFNALDALFWLTDEPINASLTKQLKKNGVLFQYANGKISNERSFMVFNQQTYGETQPVKIFKSIAPKDTDHSEVLWKDGFGKPLLTLKQDDLSAYTLYSRLNPKWTDLVWKAIFVRSIFPIIYAEKPPQFGFEPKVNAGFEGQEPVLSFNDTKATKPILSAPQSMDRFLWILALIILIVERFLSFKRKAHLKQA